MKKITLLVTSVMAVVLLSSGIALAASITCQAGADCLGTKNADILEGTASGDSIYGRAGGDTLKGFGETDYMYGQGSADRLLGGPGLDDLIGGAGNDALRGGEGLDYYLFGDGWGKDTITDAATPNTQLTFLDSQKGPVMNNLVVDLAPGPGPEAKDAGGTNTVNWEGDVIYNVYGGYGDDNITGNAADNVINGNVGDDAIVGGEGDDTIDGYWGDDVIDVDDQSFGDNVHCGPGQDTVYYDSDHYHGFFSDYVNPIECEYLHAQ
jgi:Ca2+-binding RTX toxin-like protein